MRRRITLISAAAGALALLASGISPATAATDPDELATGLVSPLSLAVGSDGTVYVAQNRAGVLTKVAPGEEATPVYADEGGREIGGVSVSGDVVTFTATGQEGAPEAKVYTLDSEGNQTEIADLWAYEKKHNPDGTTKYGIQGLSKKCVKKIPKDSRAGVVAYKGIKESHPYSSVTAGDTTYVADAAANAIWAINDSGVSTVAVIPPVKAKVTKKLRKNMHLPKCVQGKKFRGEGVPTDIEVGPDGNLYVTTLGGALGEMMPVGSVYRILPASGKISRMASGLMSPVGIAISATGTAYISLLFPGLIMQQPIGGEPSVFAEVPFPGDVDVQGDRVYATQTDLTNDGTTPPAGKVLSWSTAASD
jgi:hypothetical protein